MCDIIEENSVVPERCWNTPRRDSKKVVLTMADIVSSTAVIRKCLVCGEDKPHILRWNRHPEHACVDCIDTLPLIPPGMKRCPRCLAIHQRASSFCLRCTSARNKKTYDSEKARTRHLQAKFHISQEEYDLMFFTQAGCCAICGKQETKIHPVTGKVWPLCVDHNHETGEVRQLLCYRCNSLLGWVERDRGLIKKMEKYLKKHER